MQRYNIFLVFARKSTFFFEKSLKKLQESIIYRIFAQNFIFRAPIFIMNVLIVTLFMLVGIGLMLAEMFLIPGFGLAGFFSFVSLAASVAWAYMKVSPFAGHVTLFVALILLGICLYMFLRGKTLEKMSLKTDISDKVDLLKNLDVKPGDILTTTSRLAPMGKVMVGTTEVEAKSFDFIDQNTQVEVVKIEGNVLVVKPL